MEQCKVIKNDYVAPSYDITHGKVRRNAREKKNRKSPEQIAQAQQIRKERNVKFLKGASMVVRYITVPPVMAAALILITYFSNNALVGSVWDMLAALGFLCVMPILSYPVHAIIPPLRRRGRKSQRNLAIIFSITGYACGLIHAFAFHAAPQLSALYLTYAISGSLIAICTFAFKFKASGHASGVAGPVAALTLMVSPYYAFGTILLVACALSSIYVKRHTAAEFIAGATFTVAALFLSMAIMGVL